jgi:hypothetical protein
VPAREAPARICSSADSHAVSHARTPRRSALLVGIFRKPAELAMLLRTVDTFAAERLAAVSARSGAGDRVASRWRGLSIRAAGRSALRSICPGIANAFKAKGRPRCPIILQPRPPQPGLVADAGMAVPDFLCIFLCEVVPEGVMLFAPDAPDTVSVKSTHQPTRESTRRMRGFSDPNRTRELLSPCSNTIFLVCLHP